MLGRESIMRKSDVELVESTSTISSEIVEETSETQADAAPSTSKVSVPLTMENYVKHQILTAKAKMNIKPHAPVACRDYKIMVREEKDFKNRSDWDSGERCLLRDMIQSKRDNVNANHLLVKQREENALMRTERDKQIQELENDQLAFGASFVHFDSFVKENLDKKERGFENIEAERTIQADIDEQISQAETKIEKMSEIRDDMLKYIEDRKLFVNFLEDVRAMAPNQYGSGVHEVAERFELLLRVREELANDQTEAVIVMQELSNKMFRITDERSQQLIDLRNKVTELYSRYEAAKQEALYTQSIVSIVEAMTSKQSRQTTRVKNACWHLYQQICENHEIPVTAERHQIQEQLAVIENAILQMRRALFQVRKKKDKISDGSLGHVTFSKKPEKKNK